MVYFTISGTDLKIVDTDLESVEGGITLPSPPAPTAYSKTYALSVRVSPEGEVEYFWG